MKLILDNNILFSLMKPDSTNSQLFNLMNCEFIAPKFILKEFRKYREECVKKSGLTTERFLLREKEINSKIEFIEFKEFKKFLEEAIKISPDEDDAPYFALALKMNIPLWSNDAELKQQDKIQVLSTRDLIEIFF